MAGDSRNKLQDSKKELTPKKLCKKIAHQKAGFKFANGPKRRGENFLFNKKKKSKKISDLEPSAKKGRIRR